MNSIAKARITGLFLTLILGACGGGSGGGGGDAGGVPPVGDVAGGGIGGTGTGTATGFGSIIVNTTSTFAITTDTVITINGETATESDLAVGMVVSYNIGDDASADLSSGTADSISAGSLLTGPVTSVNPLQVLRQNVVTTGGTTGDNAANLALGDVVEVYGFADNNNTVQASRLELKAGGAPVWELTGIATNVVADTSFSIGNQTATLNGVVPRDCTDGFNNGDLVEVKATPPASFSDGDALDTVTDVECVAAGLTPPDNPVGTTIPAEIEGFVNSVTSVSDFVVSGQAVVTNASTIFVDGTVDDLFVGSKVEAEGQLDTGTGVLTATTVKFKETRVRIEAPLTSADVVAGESLEILGITVVATAFTEDEDGIIASGTVNNQQVEVRGFVDSTGTVFATRVRERGDPDPNDVRLRGPVSNIVPPLFEILGVTVDAGSAAQIFNAAGNTIDMDQFFNLISDGSNVQVEDGQYDGVSRINNGEIEIED